MARPLLSREVHIWWATGIFNLYRAEHSPCDFVARFLLLARSAIQPRRRVALGADQLGQQILAAVRSCRPWLRRGLSLPGRTPPLRCPLCALDVAQGLQVAVGTARIRVPAGWPTRSVSFRVDRATSLAIFRAPRINCRPAQRGAEAGAAEPALHRQIADVARLVASPGSGTSGTGQRRRRPADPLLTCAETEDDARASRDPAPVMTAAAAGLGPRAMPPLCADTPTGAARGALRELPAPNHSSQDGRSTKWGPRLPPSRRLAPGRRGSRSGAHRRRTRRQARRHRPIPPPAARRPRRRRDW